MVVLENILPSTKSLLLGQLEDKTLLAEDTFLEHRSQEDIVRAKYQMRDKSYRDYIVGNTDTSR